MEPGNRISTLSCRMIPLMIRYVAPHLYEETYVRCTKQMGNKNIKKSLLLDVDLCVGCFACEVACKQEHNLPVGRRWIRVVKEDPKKVGGKLFMHFVPVHCRHCGKPPCIDVCPVGAISKRSDGIVLSNEKLCIGCKISMEACPFGARQ